MMAENSLSGYASLDIAEIVEAVPDIPRDCRMFVFVDDKGLPLLTQYFRMTNGDVGNSNTVLFNKVIALNALTQFHLNHR